MRRCPLALVAILICCAVGDHVIFAQNRPCDPDHDRRNPNLQAAKEAKKAQLRRAGYPERFMKLIDQEECIACVREASDAFHIMIVYKDNAYAPTDPKTGNKWTHISTNWDPESELIAREKTKDGTIKGYYILNTLKRACKCCPDIDDQKLPEDYSDWDEDLQANKNHLIPFDQSNTTGPPPDDLINPPEQWINDPVPNIEIFQKPPRKQISTPCPQCAADALKLNDAYSALDELWDQRISLMNEQSTLENAEAVRRNEISLMRYRQRSALTRTPDGDQKIEEAEKAQDADSVTMRRNALELEVLTKQIDALTSQIESLLKALETCAERCKTSVVTETPPPSIAVNTNPPRPTQPPRTSGPLPPVDAFACPACQKAADDVRAAEREVRSAEARLQALRDREAGLQGVSAGGVEAAGQNVQTMLMQIDYDIRKQKLEVDQRRSTLIDAVIALRDCNEGCSKPGTNIEQPSLTPPDTPTAVPQPSLPPREVFVPPGVSSPPPAPPSIVEASAACPECEQTLKNYLETVRQYEAVKRATPYDSQLAGQWMVREDQGLRALTQCNMACKKPVAPPPPVTPAPDPAAKCKECELWAERLKNARAGLAQAQRSGSYGTTNWPMAVSDTLRALENCNNSCTNVEQPNLPPAGVFTPKPTAPAAPPPSCFGESCGNDWNICESNDSCPPVEEDCGIPGTCEETNPGGGGLAPLVNPTDGFTWTTSINIQIDIRIQDKVADLLDPGLYPQYLQQVPGFGSSLLIPPAARQGVGKWFDPLGLLARRMVDQIERWRGSVGPRPLIRTRDLELIDRVSNVQAAGLPKGVHVLLTDQGGSTGRTLVMNVLNLTGQPVRLSSKPFAVQPIQPQAQQQVIQAFSRLSQAAPVRLDLAAYCVEFLKAPPGPSTLLRLAPANVQQKYASMSKILQSAYRVSKGNALHPDSNPAAYTDSMKQWSIWVVEQNLNEARFTEAFLGHTKKNVEAAKQQWSKQADDMIRAASPNRWRDIVKILQGAGVPVPR